MQPVPMDELRAMIREECQAAVREELRAMLTRALAPPRVAAPEPATWAMSLPEVVDLIAKIVEPDLLREVLAYERQRPTGARPGVIAAGEVRLVEIGG